MHTNVKLNRPINCAVLTVSDTRDKTTDKGGQLIQELLTEMSDEVVIQQYEIVKDDLVSIQQVIETWKSLAIDVIITTGGTGIALRDVTIEAVKPMLTKEIEGFGELFRYLSYTEDVGTRALLSRALGGTMNQQLIFCLPGSTGAIRLAITKLIRVELTHLVHEMTKKN